MVFNSSTGIALLVTVGLLSGCHKALESELRIPQLKQPYPQSYSIPQPVNKVWQAVLKEVEAKKLPRYLVNDENFHVISWAEFKKGHCSIALTVLRIKPADANDSHLFMRRVCYPYEFVGKNALEQLVSRQSWERNGYGLGVYENAFVQRVRRRLGR